MSAIAADKDPVIEARALHLRFGAVEALRQLSIRVRPGEIHAIIGLSPNRRAAAGIGCTFQGIQTYPTEHPHRLS